MTGTYNVDVVCPCTLASSITSASYTYNVNTIIANDGLSLFTTSGASCGTVTHSLSHLPNTAGIFSTHANGYDWYTTDSSLVATYTVTVTATEDGCNNSLTGTYTVDVVCPCTLASSITTASYTYNVNTALANDGLSLFTTSGASCGTVTHSLSHLPNTAGIFSTSGNGY